LAIRNREILQQLKDWQDASEQYREARVTPNNLGRSSRSIKITRIAFTGDYEGKNHEFIINLIDTAGYETYTKDQLQAHFDEYYPSTAQAKHKKQWYVDNTLAEGTFIQQSLDYIQLSVKRFDEMQRRSTRRVRAIVLNEEAFKKGLIENPIKLNNPHLTLQWLSPYLVPRSTVVLLTTFKASMESDEVPAAQSTLQFLDGVLRDA